MNPEAQLDDQSPDFQRELAESFNKKFCSRPFEVKPGVHVRCQSRRKSVCPSCADIFSGDWKAILRSGVFDTEPGEFRFYLLTLTAPSFGAVHTVAGPNQPKKRCACGRHHGVEETSLGGTPVDPDSYDYLGAASWNRDLGVLFDATRSKLRRAFPQFEYAVAREWQRRLQLHTHVLVRMPSSENSSALQIMELARSTWATSRVDGTVVEWGRQSTCDEFPVDDTGGGTIFYLSKALSYMAKDFQDGQSGGGHAHHRRFDEVARHQMRCERCPRNTPSLCHSKLHGNLGAKQQLVSVSRKTAERPGWSLSRLTRAGQRSQRREWAIAAMESEGADAPGASEYRRQAGEWAAQFLKDSARDVYESHQ